MSTDDSDTVCVLEGKRLELSEFNHPFRDKLEERYKADQTRMLTCDGEQLHVVVLSTSKLAYKVLNMSKHLAFNAVRSGEGVTLGLPTGTAGELEYVSECETLIEAALKAYSYQPEEGEG